jgi:molybdate transport system substrate-binding protein
MRIAKIATALSIGSVILCAQVFSSKAAELKLKVADPLTAVINELGPRFERDTGHKLVAKITPGPVVKRDIDAGEAFDLAISITPAIDDLIKEGKIIASSRADVAYSGIGVGMRRGAPRPDISSVEAFKHALLNAKSVAYAAQGASGAYFLSLIARLGIAEQMKPKLKPMSVDEFGRAVLSGEVEMVVVTTSLIVATRSTELVGPVPTELQFYNSFAAGVGSDAQQAELAKVFIKFITSPTTTAVFKVNGMEPGAPQK